ncbi:tRNA-guanine transglycosylase [Trichuris suis]|nr:tRNA-guanine transglycosylase [Trichuris suis]
MMAGNLTFEIVARCPVTRARAGVLHLPRADVESPVFMPVGTQGTIKGLLPEQVVQLGYKMMLGNTYHLGHRPGADVVEAAGGLHKFMNWPYALLTDSGGFQMVSLSKLMAVSEEGVRFVSPHTQEEMLLTPEQSVHIQNSLGADVIMQLDDVVHVLTTGPRVEEAMHRSIRWLDRCIAANKKPSEQNLFPIVQGGLCPRLRQFSATGSYSLFAVYFSPFQKRDVEEISKRNCPGYAVGGLSGGEEKSSFWKMVKVSADNLPETKPRYLMGVGFAVDMLVSIALGIDMFDCVYPTRTARFGRALLPGATLDLKKTKYNTDFTPVQEDCKCSTCATYTRAYLSSVAVHETIGCNLITVHNLYHHRMLMSQIRQSIVEQRFVEFAKDYLQLCFPKGDVPLWVREAMHSVGIEL